MLFINCSNFSKRKKMEKKTTSLPMHTCNAMQSTRASDAWACEPRPAQSLSRGSPGGPAASSYRHPPTLPFLISFFGSCTRMAIFPERKAGPLPPRAEMWLVVGSRSRQSSPPPGGVERSQLARGACGGRATAVPVAARRTWPPIGLS